MRLEDRTLARKLLNIRQNMNRTKAALTCQEHAEMLDNFTWEIEEEKELDEKHKSMHFRVSQKYATYNFLCLLLESTLCVTTDFFLF